tara:strand:- start:907 stop:1176 length:270 start_codon:yes stop_codon:yes gene_type:complete
MEYYINMYIVAGEQLQTLSDIPHYAQPEALEEIDDWDGHRGHVYDHTIHYKDGVIRTLDLTVMVREMLCDRASERRHIAISRATLEDAA